MRPSMSAPRAYLSTALDDRISVFMYPESDPKQRTRRYALVVPEPKTFSTNGMLTAFWGRSPLLMNFAPGVVRSFATFTQTRSDGTRQIPVRARLEANGYKPQ